MPSNLLYWPWTRSAAGRPRGRWGGGRKHHWEGSGYPHSRNSGFPPPPLRRCIIPPKYHPVVVRGGGGRAGRGMLTAKGGGPAPIWDSYIIPGDPDVLRDAGTAALPGEGTSIGLVQRCSCHPRGLGWGGGECVWGTHQCIPCIPRRRRGS